MRIIPLLAFAFSLLACSDSTTKTESSVKENANTRISVPADMHGFAPTYSVSFVMDSAKNVETVLALWKDWKDGNLSVSRPHFADTIAMFFADGTTLAGPADTVINKMQDYRNSIQSMEVIMDVIFPVKSKDQLDSWVNVWGVVIPTSRKGKTDTVSFQETWRFNESGKIDLMFQATRKGMLPTAKK